MSIYQVPPNLLEDIWPSIESYVAGACEFHPFMDAEDVRTMLQHDYLSLFIVTDADGVLGFGVLEVVQYPRRRVANILGAGGRRGFLSVGISELLPFMIEHGKTQGATVVALSGRPGWLRALRHLHGRNQRFVTWWADIDEPRRRQGRRQFTAADDHAGTVEARSALHN